MSNNNVDRFMNEYEDIPKKVPAFVKGYRIYLCVWLLIIIGVCAFLWISLSKYQKNVDAREQEEAVIEQTVIDNSKPEQAAQKCFTEYIEGLDVDGWVSLWNEKHPEHFDEDSAIAEMINERVIGPGFELYKVSDFTMAEPRYAVVSGEDTIAEITMAGSGENYSVSDVEFKLEGEYSLSMYIPSGFSAYLSGSEVSDEHITENTRIASVDGFEDILINPMQFNEMCVNGLVADKSNEVITVTSADGRSALKSIDSMYYPVLNDEEGEPYRQKANDFIEALLRYYTIGKDNPDANMAAVLAYLVPGTPSYRVISDSYSGIIWRPADYSLHYDIEISPTYVMADNCFCVDASYAPIGKGGAIDADDSSASEESGGDNESANSTEETTPNDQSLESGIGGAVDGGGTYRMYFIDGKLMHFGAI